MATNIEFLQGLMERYTTDHLARLSPEEFRKEIDMYLEMDDHEMEGYESSEGQRHESVRFYWGHDHDFGDFKLEGKAGDRHIQVMAKFLEMGLPRDLTDTKVLDIGVWTGGTSLLLAAMGADVDAIEEVKKYINAANFLFRSFDVDLWTVALSIYKFPIPQEGHDYVIFAGVLYHLTDPVVALRIIFNSLKDGGSVFLETACINDVFPSFEYRGPSVQGWNWMIPTKGALKQLLLDVGFEDVHIEMARERRAYATGMRKKHKEILRAGLSRRNIA